MLRLLTTALLCASASAGSIASILEGRSDMTTLTAALKAQGPLWTALSSATGTYTLFAPTDAAFTSGNMAAYKVKFLLDPANEGSLTSLLKYHAVSTVITTSAMTDKEAITTLEGQKLHIGKSGSSVTVHDETCSTGTITAADVTASNGVVQVVDTVFVPAGVFCPDMVFIAEQRQDSRISSFGYDCRSNGTKVVADKETKPVGLTVDDKAKLLVWSNDYDYPHQSNHSWITAMNYNGSNKRRILRDVIDPQGLRIDHAAGKMYYTEHSGYKVSRCNLDGSDIEVLIERKGDDSFQPADVAIDVANNKMFVTAEKSPANINGTLYMMTLDGKNVTVLKRGLNQNYGLCVDTFALHVFSIEGGHGGHINCHAYGKTPCAKDPVADILEYPYMCAVDNVWAKYGGPTRILFTQANIPGQLMTVNNDGTEQKQVHLDHVGPIAAPMGLELACSK